MKLKQEPKKRAAEPKKTGCELAPTTTLMHRGTTGERDAFKGKGMTEEIEKRENKGAQKGKTPLGLWQPNRTEDIVC